MFHVNHNRTCCTSKLLNQLDDSRETNLQMTGSVAFTYTHETSARALLADTEA